MWLQPSRSSHDPFQHLFPLLFDSFAAPRVARRGDSGSRVQVESDDKGYRLRGIFPGVRREDVELNVSEDSLELKVGRTPSVPEGYTPIRQEREPFRFERRIALSQRIDPEQVEAHFENGVLTVTLTRREAELPRTIAITGRS